jgi:hypothetical protein
LPNRKLGQSHYNLVLAVHQADVDLVYLGETRIWRSTDGGQHWDVLTEPSSHQPGVHADQHVLVIDPVPTTAIIANLGIWAGNDGGIWRSQDGGTSFGSRNRGLQTIQYYHMGLHPTEPAIVVAGAQDNGTQRFVDSPAWTLSAYGDGCYAAIDPAQPTTWYGGTFSYGARSDGFNGISRSDEAGALDSWSLIKGSGSTAIGNNDDALFYAPFMLEPSSNPATPSPVWLGTDRLYRSEDKGDSWHQISTVLLDATDSTTPSDSRGVSAIGLVPGHPETVFVGTSEGNLWRLDRPGATWPATPLAAVNLSPPTVPPPPSFNGITPQLLTSGAASRNICCISAIAVSPSVASRVFVTVGDNYITGPGPANPMTARFFRSDDNGQTFAAIPFPPVTANGVIVNTPQNSANCMVIDPDHPDLVYIGCTIGVFQYDSTSGAMTLWKNGLPNAAVLDLQVHRVARLLRAATHGRGIWETRLDAPAAPLPAVDIILRDDIVDTGRILPSTATPDDPLHSGRQLSAKASPDIKIDTPSLFGGSFSKPGTVDYSPDGDLDYVGFALLDGSNPRRNKASKVYVHVQNRGSAAATNLKVALFWAGGIGASVPALPNDFWTAFPSSDPSGTAWQRIDTLKTFPTLDNINPVVAEFDWTAPSAAPGDVRLIGLITCDQDPLVASGTDSTAAALASKHVAVHDFSVGWSEEVWGLILTGIGVAVVGGGAVAAAELTK